MYTPFNQLTAEQKPKAIAYAQKIGFGKANQIVALSFLFDNKDNIIGSVDTSIKSMQPIKSTKRFKDADVANDILFDRKD